MTRKQCPNESLPKLKLCRPCEAARVRKAMALLNYRRLPTAKLRARIESTYARLALMETVLSQREPKHAT